MFSSPAKAVQTCFRRHWPTFLIVLVEFPMFKTTRYVNKDTGLTVKLGKKTSIVYNNLENKSFLIHYLNFFKPLNLKIRRYRQELRTREVFYKTLNS